MRVPVFALLVAIVATTAHADTLNPPTLSYNLGGQTVSLLTYYDSGANFSGQGVAYNFLNSNALGVDPELTSSVSGVNRPNQNLSSSAVITYQFEIAGPDDGTATVPVTIAAEGGVMNYTGVTFTSPDSLTGFADLSVSPANGSPVLNDSASLLGPSSFNIDPTLDLEINTVYTVYMSTDVVLFTNSSYSGTGAPVYVAASVDPTVTLDTTDPGYSLEFSPGLGSLSPTPEPSSIVLLGTGLVGAVFLARRRFRFAELERHQEPA